MLTIVAAGVVLGLALAILGRRRRITSHRASSFSEQRLLQLIAPDLFEIDLRSGDGDKAIARWNGVAVPDDQLLDALRSMPETRLSAAIDAAATTGRVSQIDDVTVPDGDQLRHFDVTVHALESGRAAAVVKDVTDRHDSVETIIYQALHDPVTGLPNRAQLEDHIIALLGEDRPAQVGVMVIEVQRVDEVNETLGHGQGDRFLHQVGRCLSDAVPARACLAQIGGGRFGLAFPVGSSVDPRVVAEHLLDALGHPIVVGDVSVLPGGTIGVSCGPRHGTTAVELLQRADAALSQRHPSSAHVQLYDAAIERRTRAELDLSGEIRRALDDSEFIVHYQPTTDASTGEILGAEALVRWNHPTKGLLGPSQFLDLVETVGLGHELTEQVLGTALDDCCRWHNAGWDLDISVNVTAQDLQRDDAVELFNAAIENVGLDPKKLILEVTERQLLADAEPVFQTFSALREYGIRCSIDDFGTGFSSVSHLRLLPAEELKIDRSFVSRMAESPPDRIIVRNLITLAHDLGHRVVAEGVEDEWTAKELDALGCDRLQGFFFHHPVSAGHFALLMAQSRPGQDPITAI